MLARKSSETLVIIRDRNLRVGRSWLPPTMSRHLTLFAACAVTSLLSACSAPSSQREAKPAIEQLESTPRIEAVIYDFVTGSQRTTSISNPTELATVKGWIRSHAWPPIDLNTTGNVMPRGYFNVFDLPSDTPQVIHVSSNDWQTLLSVIQSR